MMSVSTTTTSNGAFTAGKPEALFEESYIADTAGPGNPNYDVSPDGRFLMIKPTGGSSEGRINIVLDWDEELKRLVP